MALSSFSSIPFCIMCMVKFVLWNPQNTKCLEFLHRNHSDSVLLFIWLAVFDSPVFLKFSLKNPSLRTMPENAVLWRSQGFASQFLDECSILRASFRVSSEISASLDFWLTYFPPLIAWRAILAAAGTDWFLNIGKSCCRKFWDRSDERKGEKLCYQKVVVEGQFYVGFCNLSSCYKLNERLNLPFSAQISSNQSLGEELDQICRISIYLFTFD